MLCYVFWGIHKTSFTEDDADERNSIVEIDDGALEDVNLVNDTYLGVLVSRTDSLTEINNSSKGTEGNEE